MDTIDASMCRLQQCYAGTFLKLKLNTFSPFIISNVRVPIFSALSTLTSGSATTPVSIFRREAGTYFTSDQHKEATRARKERDRKDTLLSTFVTEILLLPMLLYEILKQAL
jgi:hypothetical protein